jgi:hypothetical protein
MRVLETLPANDLSNAGAGLSAIFDYLNIRRISESRDVPGKVYLLIHQGKIPRCGRNVLNFLADR